MSRRNGRSLICLSGLHKRVATVNGKKVSRGVKSRTNRRPLRRAVVPLLDHFHPPLSAERRWESFHSSWATRLADALTERWLPPNYIAEEHAHFGPSVEIDVATV